MPNTVVLTKDTPGRHQLLLPGAKPWLNLGCGFIHIKGADNADNNPDCKPQLVFDINDERWPIDTETYGWVVMMNVLEHLSDGLHAIGEAWRVLKPGGHLDIVVPHWLHKSSIEDPTHVRFFSHQSAEYWKATTYTRNTSWYSSARFDFSTENITLARDEASGAETLQLLNAIRHRPDPASKLLAHLADYDYIPGRHHHIAYHLKKQPMPEEQEPTLHIVDLG